MIEHRPFKAKGVAGAWGRKGHGTAAGRRRHRPGLEALEDRCLLASVVDFSTPTADASPYEITAGPDGNLWFTEANVGKVGVVNSSTDAIMEFTVDQTGSTNALDGITTGSDGNIWFTDSGTNSIGVINPTTDAIAEFPIPTTESFPAGITSGANGNLWFTEQQGGKIGEIDPSTHAISEFNIPTAGTLPGAITVAPDGDLWFTEVGANAIGSFDPTTHTFSQAVIPAAQATPYDLTATADGNIWFTSEEYNEIEMFDPTTSTFTALTIPTADAGAVDIAPGPFGDLYFTELNGNQIGALNPTTHDISETTIPTTDSGAWGIAGGPNQSVWFTESSASKVGVDFGSHLVFTSQPSGPVTAGEPIVLTVSDVDSSGTVDDSFDGQATITVTGGPTGAVLHGTLTAPFIDGVATFDGPTIDQAGNGYAIQVATAAAPLQTTNTFNVSPSQATQLLITSPPPRTLLPGADFDVAVELADQYGNIVTAYSGTVNVALGNNPGGSMLSGTTRMSVGQPNSSAGTATFRGLSLNNPGDGYTLVFSATGVTTTATTNMFNVQSPGQPPPVPPPPATVDGVSVVVVQKKNKKGKNVGKPVVTGYEITFGTAMNQQSLADPSNYLVDSVVLTKRTRKKPSSARLTPIAHTITNVSGTSATLSLSGSPFLKKAGMITLVVSSTGLESAAGAPLASEYVIAIARGGKSISIGH